ncbi:MAG: prepilin-type N-terminal cleavage/methylation domain-containing protein [Candidatus Omnitrophica bacterium]|nr:prepilin-type N-terminal cleavage/methylation domain-containing protein [Candidatus Omnitrophota bacterium]
MKRPQGVTLVELVAVVIVLAVLLGVAIPSYGRTKERNYYRVATTLLQTIYSGERAYCFTKTSVGNRRYYAPTNNGGTNADWDPIFMDKPTVTGITFAVTAPTPGALATCDTATFTATATRTSGPCNGRTAQITETGKLTTPNNETAWSDGTC